MIGVVLALEPVYGAIYGTEAPKHVIENNFDAYNNLRSYYISGINDTSSVLSTPLQFTIIA